MTDERAHNKQKYGVVLHHISDYPPPAPPTLKLDYVYQPLNNWKIDAKAKETPHNKLFDFPTLVDHLTEHLKTDVQKVRAIFVWLGHQDVQSSTYPNQTDQNTPIGYLQRIKSDHSLYVQFFTLLCREADIPCVILTGLARDCGYEAGEKESSQSTWNAVYVEGGWRHVHCNWAFISVVRKTSGGWLKVEEDGKQVREEIKQCDGEVKHKKTVDDSFFFMPPEIFIFFCFPEESKWQLLSAPVSKMRFYEAPFISPQYVESGFSFRKGQVGLFNSQKGECAIIIKAHGSWRGKLKYALFYKKNITHRFPHSDGDHGYVAMFNKNEKNEIKFNLRFPIEGNYRLRLYEEKECAVSRICDFKILCQERRAVCEPFLQAPPNGWGPGHNTTKFGLYNISHKEGFLEIKNHHYVDISFNTKVKQGIKANLKHTSRPDSVIMKFLTIVIRNDLVKIRVTPDEGEYALIINSHTKDMGEMNVLNYIIVSGQVNRKHDSVRENPTEKIIRQQLLEETKRGNRKDLAGTIEKFKKLRMADRGDLTAAKWELEVAEIRESLKFAIMRRREDGLEKAISRAEHSKMKENVQEDLNRAQRMLNTLLYQRSTPRLRETAVTPQDVADLRAIRVLSAPIKEVFTAVYLLLGENRWNLDDPYNLQCLMKQSGSNGLLSRLESFDPKRVQPDVVQDANRLLEKQHEEKLVRISLPLGKIYQEGLNLVQKCYRIQSLTDTNKCSPVQDNRRAKHVDAK